MWLRFFLMTYFEITIACLIGTQVEVFLPAKLTQADRITIICERVSKAMIVLFPVFIMIGMWAKQRKENQIQPMTNKYTEEISKDIQL